MIEAESRDARAWHGGGELPEHRQVGQGTIIEGAPERIGTARGAGVTGSNPPSTTASRAVDKAPGTNISGASPKKR